MVLEARVALITGAGRGLGRELALALSRNGVAIAALDRDPQGLLSLEAEIRNLGGSIAWELADVTDAPSMAAKVALLEEQLGPIDLVIANAGIGKETPAHDFRADEVARLVNINLLGVTNTVAAVLPGMIERRRGHIVGISSLASLHGLPRMIGYCASKAGVNALLESLRLELKQHDITVTTVCPGYMKTPMNAEMNQASLMDMTTAVNHVLHAIRKRHGFYAFPRSQAMGLWFVRLLPGWLSDWLVLRNVPPHLDAKPAVPPLPLVPEVAVPVLEEVR
jgi:NAD(P)-dependent dehydrogenase (short-subunit alcohol dehydrogenase family)